MTRATVGAPPTAHLAWCDDEAPKSLVDLHLVQQPDESTVVEIRHEHIPGGWDTDAITQHWEEALDRIAEAS